MKARYVVGKWEGDTFTKTKEQPGEDTKSMRDVLAWMRKGLSEPGTYQVIREMRADVELSEVTSKDVKVFQV